jgi:signal peptidase I
MHAKVRVVPLLALLVLGLSSCGSGGTHNASPSVVHVSAPHYTGYHMPSSSMEPTLHCARPAPGCLANHPDRPAVESLQADPKRGDIVVFRTPAKAVERCGAGGVFIKRLVGLPGETIQEKVTSGKGYIFINGHELDEPYIQSARRDSRGSGPYRIPNGKYFLLGDNRVQSCDSREWGPVPRKNIIGTVVTIYRQG